MAYNENGNIFEQHVEKGILAVTILVFAYAMAHWVFTSPTRVNGLPLDEADSSLLQKARLIKEANNPKTPSGADKIDLPNYFGQIRQLQDPAPQRPMVDLAQGSTPIFKDKRRPVPPPPLRTAEFQKGVLAPEKPHAAAMYQLPNSDPLSERLAAHPLTLWPAEKVASAWAGVVATRENVAPPKPLVLRVETEVVQVGSDAKPVGQPRKITPAGPAPQGTDGKPLPPFQMPNPATATPDEMDAAVTQLGSLQNVILHPPYWDVWDAAVGRWVAWQQALVANTGAALPKTAAGESLLWTHQDTLKPGLRYRYRVRVILLNPLYGKTTLAAENPSDAKIVELPSPWSPWSDPVSVTRTTRFFLSGSIPPSGEGSGGWVKVTVFTESIGQPVSASFKVSPGQAIGHVQNTPTRLPDRKSGRVVTINRPVDYSTGAVVLDLKFDQRYYKRTIVKRTVEMAYVDSAGQVHIRQLDTDQDRLRQLTRPTPPSARPATPRPAAGNNAPEPRLDIPRDPGSPRPPAGGTRRPSRPSPRPRNVTPGTPRQMPGTEQP